MSVVRMACLQSWAAQGEVRAWQWGGSLYGTGSGGVGREAVEEEVCEQEVARRQVRRQCFHTRTVHLSETGAGSQSSGRLHCIAGRAELHLNSEEEKGKDANVKI